MAYLVSDFLTLVRQYGMLPSTTANGTADADILRVADEELRTRITPLVVASRQEWWVVVGRTALTANQQVYKIPRRAVGGRLRELQIQRSDGTFRNLKRLELEESYRYNQTSTGEPEAFWIKGEAVYLWPKPATTSGHLRFDFMARPGRLTSTSPTNYAISQITDLPANEVYLYTTTAPVTVGEIGYVDIVRAGSGFSYLSVDVYGESVSGPIFQVYSKYDLPDDYTSFIQGDYCFPSDQCFVVPLPAELHGVFVNFTVAALKRQLGDLQSAQVFEATAQKMAADSLQTFEPRSDGEPRKLRGGLLWRTKSPWWNWR